MGNADGDFITVGLVDDLLLVQFDFGLISFHRYINTSISDGQWHLLVLTYHDLQANVTVDNKLYTLLLNTSVPVMGAFDVYIGSLPDSLPQSFNLIQQNGFIGSVIEFQVQSVEIDLIDTDSNIGRNIRQSMTLFCSYVTCMNGGVCQDTIINPWFKCDCPFGYNGTFCEVPLPFCSPNPCNGGECREFHDRTFVCSCPLGYEGRFCDEGMYMYMLH